MIAVHLIGRSLNLFLVFGFGSLFNRVRTYLKKLSSWRSCDLLLCTIGICIFLIGGFFLFFFKVAMLCVDQVKGMFPFCILLSPFCFIKWRMYIFLGSCLG